MNNALRACAPQMSQYCRTKYTYTYFRNATKRDARIPIYLIYTHWTFNFQFSRISRARYFIASYYMCHTLTRTYLEKFSKLTSERYTIYKRIKFHKLLRKIINQKYFVIYFSQKNFSKFSNCVYTRTHVTQIMYLNSNNLHVIYRLCEVDECASINTPLAVARQIVSHSHNR